MPKPTAPDLAHLTQAEYLKLFDEYAKVALASILTFHGACSGNERAGATFAAEIADELIVQRTARVTAIKEAALAEREASKAKPKR